MSVSNFVRTTIKSAVSSGATTIEVNTASSPFNNPPSPDDHARLFLVDSIDSPTKWEEIEYTGRSAITGGFELTGVTRNEDSSTGSAQSFDAGHFVVMSPSATTDGQGAIVESGTNSNGSYIRYENGVQICWHNIEISMSGSPLGTVNWTLPASFNNTSFTVNSTGDSGEFSGRLCGTGIASTTSSAQVRVRDIDGNSRTATVTAGVQAMGFWK